jgi:replicative DNA helicase
MAEFTGFEEKNIILLALDSPDFFHRIAKFMKHEYFDVEEHQYIMATYQEFYEKYDETPTREVLKDIIYKELNSDSDIAEPVMEILESEIDPRNAKYIKDSIIKWAKHKQLSMLYDEEILEKIKDGDVDVVNDIVEKAAAISDVIIKPFRFFEDIDELFVENKRDHYTTGFSRLDCHIHDGRGPARREVLIWAAPTGVGKSLIMGNTSAMNVMQNKNVLHVTLENSETVTGHRYLGVFSNIPIALRNKKDKEAEMKNRIKKIKTDTEGDLMVIYFPTDSISVREIELAMKELNRQYNFVPDILVIDYLECLLSKNQYKNRDNEYARQKAVSNELRALAATSNTFIVTASQTNRGGSKSADEGKNINLDSLSESFGKAMPTDYVITINQSENDYKGSDDDSHIGHVKFFIAKNRNGAKYKTVNARINYATMKSMQEEITDD